MRKQRERQPWNPFPLACLKVEGLSACAKAVLIYLGVRSNYKGETCVGHRTICRELVRSKDFVTKGLAELEAKGYLEASQRDRHKHEADWRKLSASLILKSRTEPSPEIEKISPEEQDQTPMSSPDFQMSSPDRQGKTLQIDSNLPDSSFEPTDQNQRVSELSRVNDTLGAPHLATGLSEEQAKKFQEFLGKRFGVKLMPKPLWQRISHAHAEFVANPYNLDQLAKLLDRRDWTKTITNLDDFAHRWESQNEKGLYAQLKRVSVDAGPCADCGTQAPQLDDGNWLCQPCVDKRWEEHWRKARTMRCGDCHRELEIPMGWDADKFQRRVQCAVEKGGCGKLLDVSQKIVDIVSAKNECPVCGELLPNGWDQNHHCYENPAYRLEEKRFDIEEDAV